MRPAGDFFFIQLSNTRVEHDMSWKKCSSVHGSGFICILHKCFSIIDLSHNSFYNVEKCNLELSVCIRNHRRGG